MAISFGLSTLRAITNGIETGCVVTTGNVGATAVVATGQVWIGGSLCHVTAANVDISAVSPAFGYKYIFGRLAAGQSSTATLDATGITGYDPRSRGWAVIGILSNEGGSATNISTSGCTGARAFGRAQSCSINLSYDQSIARGGTLIFGNDMKLYNGTLEGSLEYATISGANFANIYGAAWASGGAGSGTLSVTATNQPLPFMVEAQSITNGVTSTVRLLKCYSNQLSLNITREEFTMPSLSFQGIANGEGNVLSWNI